MTTEPMAALVLDARGILWYSPEVQTEGPMLRMLRAQPVDADGLDCTQYETLSLLAKYGPRNDQPIEVDLCALDSWVPLTKIVCVVPTDAKLWEEPRVPVWESIWTNVVEAMRQAGPQKPRGR